MQGRGRDLRQRRRLCVRRDLSALARLAHQRGEERVGAPTRVDLAPWPAIKAYHERLRTRPKLARAFQEEMALYQAELARHKAA